MRGTKRKFGETQFDLYLLHPDLKIIEKAIAGLKSHGKRYRVLDNGYTYFVYAA